MGIGIWKYYEIFILVIWFPNIQLEYYQIWKKMVLAIDKFESFNHLTGSEKAEVRNDGNLLMKERPFHAEIIGIH